MEPEKIMPPHKEQDGFVYWRVKRLQRGPGRFADYLWGAVGNLRILMKDKDTAALMAPVAAILGAIGYDDAMRESRTISSRRVEGDVETGDFLRVCAEEGLQVTYWPDEWRNGECIPHSEDHRWSIGESGEYDHVGHGATIRQAYFRYKAQERSSQ